MRNEYDRIATAILEPLAVRASEWLEEAFKVWCTLGLDASAAGSTSAFRRRWVPTQHPRRAFVQARQAYSYCEAGRLAWNGPWREAALHAGRYLLEHYVSPEGAVIHSVDQDGHVIDDWSDLYDIAFILFALAHLYDVAGRDPAHRTTAEMILGYLRRERAHAEIGSWRLLTQIFAKTHMHLLEAALAWIEVSGDACWWALAEDLVKLAESHLIDKKSGAVFEHFASDWSPMGGREAAVIEPGHQYEWAFLLARWDRVCNRADRPACAHLFMLAEAQGGIRTAASSFMMSIFKVARPMRWPESGLRPKGSELR